MSAGWIGSIISVDCGESLGTYQGQVKTVDDGAQTLTLTGAFRNGLKCEVKELTLSARDIKYLKILMSPNDAKGIVKKQATPSKLSKELLEEPVIAGFVSPKTSRQQKDSCHHLNNRTHNGHSPVNHLNNTNHMLSPAKLKANNNNCHPGHSNGLTNGTGSGGVQNQQHTPTDEDYHRPRRNSTSEIKKKSTTPRKIDFKKRSTPREDCFSAPTESYLDEFDFEKNLALFDKKAVFEEIENACCNGTVIYAGNGDRRPAKYRCDENVLQSEPVVLKQIKVPSSDAKTYFTDSGLMVPSISYSMRKRLLSAAELAGFNEPRLLEMVGRSASEMVLQLLGGSHRMSPQNNHQRPVVVVLCGSHGQGAQGVNCARQLANHNVQTTVFVPCQTGQHNGGLEQELRLYQLTGNKTTSLITDLPTGIVDMIVTAIDGQENPDVKEQQWYKMLCEWVPHMRAPVLAIDPPPEGTSFQSKWSLGLGLPLNLPPSCGQVYLSDLSLPKKVFTDLGIKYMSPFGHKFVIPLHAEA